MSVLTKHRSHTSHAVPAESETMFTRSPNQSVEPQIGDTSPATSTTADSLPFDTSATLSLVQFDSQIVPSNEFESLRKRALQLLQGVRDAHTLHAVVAVLEKQQQQQQLSSYERISELICEGSADVQATGLAAATTAPNLVLGTLKRMSEEAVQAETDRITAAAVAEYDPRSPACSAQPRPRSGRRRNVVIDAGDLPPSSIPAHAQCPQSDDVVKETEHGRNTASSRLDDETKMVHCASHECNDAELLLLLPPPPPPATHTMPHGVVVRQSIPTAEATEEKPSAAAAAASSAQLHHVVPQSASQLATQVHTLASSRRCRREHHVDRPASSSPVWTTPRTSATTSPTHGYLQQPPVHTHTARRLLDHCPPHTHASHSQQQQKKKKSTPHARLKQEEEMRPMEEAPGLVSLCSATAVGLKHDASRSDAPANTHDPESSGLPSVGSCHVTASPFSSSFSCTFTTVVMEKVAMYRDSLCNWLWQRQHAVLSARPGMDSTRLLTGAVDILLVDPMQWTAVWAAPQRRTGDSGRDSHANSNDRCSVDAECDGCRPRNMGEVLHMLCEWARRVVVIVTVPRATKGLARHRDNPPCTNSSCRSHTNTTEKESIHTTRDEDAMPTDAQSTCTSSSSKESHLYHSHSRRIAAAYRAEGLLTLWKPCGAAAAARVIAAAERIIAERRRAAVSIAQMREMLTSGTVSHQHYNSDSAASRAACYWNSHRVCGGMFTRRAWRRGRLLGRGSGSAVYEAFDTLTGGVMAVKEIRLCRGDVAHMEQFIGEVLALCRLQHPNIIHYFYFEQSTAENERNNSGSSNALAGSACSNCTDSNTIILDDHGREGSDAGDVVRVFMEYAAGGTLQHFLRSARPSGQLDFAELQRLLRDITEGLAYIHEQHYVHADLKPANVLLTDGGTAKIGDFGTARLVRHDKLIHVMRGSPLYMSPECMSAGERIGVVDENDAWDADHGTINTNPAAYDDNNHGEEADGSRDGSRDGSLMDNVFHRSNSRVPHCNSHNRVPEPGTRTRVHADGEAWEKGGVRIVGYSFPTDIWSLGCVAMEMITGQPPFSHVAAAHAQGPAGLTRYITSLTDVPDLSPLFHARPCAVEFVQACLNTDPARRPTAKALLSFSLFAESAHADTASALQALHRAQLLHTLNQFTPFREEGEGMEQDANAEEEGVQASISSEAQSDLFFQSSSSSTDTDSDSEDAESG